jgi:hypothetical protein
MTMQPNGDNSGAVPPQNDAGQASTPAGQSPVTPITEEQLNARLSAFADELKSSFESAYRGVQSNNDRAVSRMQQVQKQIEQSLAGFPGATPEQIRDFSQRKAIETLFEQQQATEQAGNVPGQGQPAQPGQGQNGQEPAQQDPNDWVNNAAAALVTEFGFDLEENDPAVAELKKFESDPNPWNWLNKYRELLAAKATQQNQSLPARTPSMVTGTSAPSNDIAEITDPDVLFRIARERGRI